MRRGVSKVAVAVAVLVVAIAIAVVAMFLTRPAAPTTPTKTATATRTPTPTKTAVPATPTPKLERTKICVVYDIGGRGDLSFNDMAWLGAEKAMEDFKVDVTYLTPPSLADMKPLLEEYAGSGEYSLLVLIGFLWTTPLNEVADNYPDQKFALIDAISRLASSSSRLYPLFQRCVKDFADGWAKKFCQSCAVQYFGTLGSFRRCASKREPSYRCARRVSNSTNNLRSSSSRVRISRSAASRLARLRW